MVDEVVPQVPEQELKAKCQEHTDGQRPEARDRLIWHHAVVDVHDEEWNGQRKAVDQERHDEDVTVNRPERYQGPRKPAFPVGRGRQLKAVAGLG